MQDDKKDLHFCLKRGRLRFVTTVFELQDEGREGMRTNLTAHITQLLPGFSKGQRRIAAYILEHYDEAAYMTANCLGKTVGVSESTVVRFAAELGYEGYPQLQKAIQELVRSKLTSVQRVEVSRARMRDEEVLDSVMTYDMANIRQTLEELPREVFDEAVRDLVDARRVYVFGAGSCRPLANFLAYYLKLLLPDICLISTSSETEILEEMILKNPPTLRNLPTQNYQTPLQLFWDHQRNVSRSAVCLARPAP